MTDNKGRCYTFTVYYQFPEDGEGGFDYSEGYWGFTRGDGFQDELTDDDGEEIKEPTPEEIALGDKLVGILDFAIEYAECPALEKQRKRGAA